MVGYEVHSCEIVLGIFLIRAKLYLVHNFMGLCYYDRYSIYLCSGSAKFFVYLNVSVVQRYRIFCFKGWFIFLLKSRGMTY